MKKLILMFSLMLVCGAFAQDSIPETNWDQDNQLSMSASQSDQSPSFYSFENQEYKFIPNELGYHIMRIDNGREVDYGTLMLTTDDGYYAMTSNLNDHVSYGRFDDAGNFKGLRYDEASDTVLEENFTKNSGRGN